MNNEDLYKTEGFAACIKNNSILMPMRGDCRVCNKPFKRKTHNHVICSDECREKFYAKEPGVDLSSGTVGAISELMVSAQLLKEGWCVFRSLSSTAFCDIVAIKNGTIRLIEVRTGTQSASGVISYPKITHGPITEYAVWVKNLNKVFFYPVNSPVRQAQD